MSKRKGISRDALGLAGKFAVASELCKRDVVAQPTLDKGTRNELFVKSGKLRIQVKSKQGKSWPAVKGIAGNDSYLVFVDFADKDLLSRPDFFILSSLDWIAFTDQLVRAGLDDKQKATLSADFVPTYSDGFVGATVSPEQLEEYREKWAIITERAAS